MKSLSSRAASQQTVLERMHQEAQEILSQRDAEIAEYTEKLEAAEKELATLNAELKRKMEENEKIPDAGEEMPDEEDALAEIEALKQKNEEEIQKVQAQNEEEILQLRDAYDKKMKEAYEWAEQHAETIAIEKAAQLADLRRELDGLRASVNDNEFLSTKTKTNLFQESKATTMANDDKIQYLENQLSELSALTRQEIRDIRAKVNETLVTADLRAKEHATEIERFTKELAEREEKYEMHINALQDQFNAEKQRYENAIRVGEEKSASLARVMKQIEKQHDKQLQTTLRDIERMKTTIYKSKARDDESLETVRLSVTRLHATSNECRNVEQELAMIRNEIAELDHENRDLQSTLQRLSKTASNLTKNKKKRSL